MLANAERHVERLGEVREDLLPVLIPELLFQGLIAVKTEQMSVIRQAEQWQNERKLIAEQMECWAQSIDLLLGEVQELEESAADLHDGLATEEDVAAELTDIILFAITALRALKFDPEVAISQKIKRNSAKYPAHELQSGVYEEKMIDLKQRWNGQKKTENIVYMSPARA